MMHPIPCPLSKFWTRLHASWDCFCSHLSPPLEVVDHLSSFALFFPIFYSFITDPDILNGVYMSEALNPIFVDNFERDPTLTWQYFGSSTGFFRLYPGKRAEISFTFGAMQ